MRNQTQTDTRHEAAQVLHEYVPFGVVGGAPKRNKTESHVQLHLRRLRRGVRRLWQREP
jgi:hypothetical protein